MIPIPTLNTQPLRVPHIQSGVTSNGWEVVHVHRPDLGISSARLMIRGGYMAGGCGVGPLCDESLLRILHKEAESSPISGDIEVGTTPTHSLYSYDGLASEMPEVLRQLASVLFVPPDVSQHIDLMKKLQIQRLQYASEQGGALARWCLSELYHGAGHPCSMGGGIRIGDFRSISIEQTQQSWADRYARPQGTVVMVGPNDMEQTMRIVEELLPAAGARAHVEVPPPASQWGLYGCQKDGASQTEIRLIRPGPRRSHEDFWPMELGIWEMGGLFDGRLNRELRTEGGFTYGAYAHLSATYHGGIVEVGTAVENESAIEALSLIQSVLNQPEIGWTEEKIQRLRHNHRQRLLNYWETNSSVADLVEIRLLEGSCPGDIVPDLLSSLEIDADKMSAQLAKLAKRPECVVLCGDLDGLPKHIHGFKEVAPTIMSD
jgi:hypothetical protein